MHYTTKVYNPCKRCPNNHRRSHTKFPPDFHLLIRIFVSNLQSPIPKRSNQNGEFPNSSLLMDFLFKRSNRPLPAYVTTESPPDFPHLQLCHQRLVSFPSSSSSWLINTTRPLQTTRKRSRFSIAVVPAVLLVTSSVTCSALAVRTLPWLRLVTWRSLSVVTVCCDYSSFDLVIGWWMRSRLTIYEIRGIPG